MIQIDLNRQRAIQRVFSALCQAGEACTAMDVARRIGWSVQRVAQLLKRLRIEGQVLAQVKCWRDDKYRIRNCLIYQAASQSVQGLPSWLSTPVHPPISTRRVQGRAGSMKNDDLDKRGCSNL